MINTYYSTFSSQTKVTAVCRHFDCWEQKAFFAIYELYNFYRNKTKQTKKTDRKQSTITISSVKEVNFRASERTEWHADKTGVR